MLTIRFFLNLYNLSTRTLLLIKYLLKHVTIKPEHVQHHQKKTVQEEQNRRRYVINQGVQVSSIGDLQLGPYGAVGRRRPAPRPAARDGQVAEPGLDST